MHTSLPVLQFDTPLASLLPANPSFTGHQTFSLRLGWLKKGIDALQDKARGGPRFFSRDDALATLGVGKNMVQSIRHWLLATQMAREVPGSRGQELEPSPLGKAIFGVNEQDGWDPFLEDDATLWLLHWKLAGPGSLAFTWAWAFNCFGKSVFTKEILADEILTATVGKMAKLPAKATIQRDVECFLHTYSVSDENTNGEDPLGCPLQELGLIRKVPRDVRPEYRFQVGPKPSLPLPLFTYALVEYWQCRFPKAKTISYKDIADGEGSPGSVFKLDGESILDYLAQLDGQSSGALRFEDTELVRQVVCASSTLPSLDRFLKSYYDVQ